MALLDRITTPGGADTSIQFNSSNLFDGFGTWDGSTFDLDGGDLDTTGTGSFDALILTGDTSVISSAYSIDLKSSGDADDYIRFLTSAGIPVIQAIGATGIHFASDDATYTTFTVYEDITHFGLLSWDKTNDWFNIRSTHALNILTNSDLDDYLSFSTSSNVPQIGVKRDGVALDADLLQFAAGALTVNGVLTVTNSAVIGSDSAVFQPGTDSTTFLQVLDADGGTPIFNVDSTNERVGIGTAAPSQALDLIGALELENTTTSTTGVIYKGADRFIHNFQHPTGDTEIPVGQNTFIGVGAGNFTTGQNATETYHASYNTGLGYQALEALTTGYGNFGLGYQALKNVDTGNNNTAIGRQSMISIEDGTLNTGVGYKTLNNLTGGVANTAIGVLAGEDVLGNFNTLIGYNAGLNITGSSNVIIGSKAAFRQIAVSNLLIIDNQLRDDAAEEITNSILYGIMADAVADQSLRVNAELQVIGGNVGIGTATPDTTLQVVGTSGFGDDSSNEILISGTGNMTFAGSAGFYPRFLTQADQPAPGTGATQIDVSELIIWKDSDVDTVWLLFSDGGTVKKVQLT